MHQPLRPVNPSLVAIPGYVVAAHRHLADQVFGKVHLQKSIVEILFDVRVLLVVQQAAKGTARSPLYSLLTAGLPPMRSVAVPAITSTKARILETSRSCKWTKSVSRSSAPILEVSSYPW